MPDNTEEIEQDEERVYCVFCNYECDADEHTRSITFRVRDLHQNHQEYAIGMRYSQNTTELVACDDCSHYCSHCGDYFTESFVQNSPDDYNIRCDDCGDNYSSCEDCEQEHHNDDMNWDEDNELPYCNDCYSDRNRNSRGGRSAILSYGHKPPAIYGFVVDSRIERVMRLDADHSRDLFMGYELETNCRTRSYDLDHIARVLLDNSPQDYLYNKEDGTISGFEIVTHPCTLEAHKLLLPREAISNLSSVYGLSSWSAVGGTGAGLHVHVSKKSFKAPTHIYKFQLFHYRNASPIKKFAGRESNRWATFDKGEYDSQVNMAKGSSVQNNRYSALNFHNQATIELRYFRGSLKPETVLGVLEFVHSVHEYTRILTTKEVANSGLEWDRYKAWLSDQNYEFLPSVMATRCV